ncbi:MAG: family 20 glycosylhydrolase [Imperialibacter sp.]|uniref:family 20 glycosylhydrolase n=1 Tax=Imperialibacter sp. TaxID=2038411 RepID=UPI0032EB6A88
MRSFFRLTLVSLPLIVFSCSTRENKPVDADDIQLSWELVENQAGGENQHKAKFTITNNGPALSGTDWAIYYNQIASHDFVLPEGAKLAIEFELGTLFKLVPKEGFELAQGETLTFEYAAGGAIVKNSQQPLGPYLAQGNDNAKTISNYQPVTLTMDNPEVLKVVKTLIPTAKNLFEKNQSLKMLPASQLGKVTPTPMSIKAGKGSFMLQTPLVIYHEAGLGSEAELLKSALSEVLDGEVSTQEGKGQSLQLKLGKSGGPESYTLSINTSGIQITGTDAAGVFYGIQSLRALLPVATYETPASGISLDQLTIDDAPRYPYRGMHLDMARNFESKETVFKLLNLMAYYKLNYFHTHLSEDEAWRLEIPGLPELTDIGSRRGHTTTEEEFLHPEYGSGPDPNDPNSPGNGFYSKADYIDILQHAYKRHIRVIPEIDIPGHSRAAIVSMKNRYNRLMKEGKTEEANQYALHDPEDASEYMSVQNFPDNVICVCRPSALTFMEKVFDEIIAMHKEAGVPLESIHIGGDEVPKGVWEKSPICEEFKKSHPEIKKAHDLMPYFIGELIKILEKKGMPTSGWQEVAMREGADGKEEVNPAFANSGMRPYVWIPDPNLPGLLANAGYTPIIANATKLYFDLAYNNDPEEPGQTWAGLVNTQSAWEIVPQNIFYSSEKDSRGNSIDVEAEMKKMVKLTPEGEKNILGIQGQLWAEVAKTPELLEYVVFPKLVGLAERAWAGNPKWATIDNLEQRIKARDAAWNGFANTMGQKEMPRLSYLEGGVGYRIPRPGAKIEGGLLLANSEYPGLIIRYTTDGSEPTANSQEYTEPVAVSSTVKLKCFDIRGRSGMSSTVSPQ